MQSMPSLIKSLKTDYPHFIFKESDSFLWSHTEHTIYYACSDDDCSLLFHELSHAILNHADYKRDIELIAMEREAWDKAKEIAKKYDVSIDDDFIQSNLDTYRDWLHTRSTCPKCSATGLQIKKNDYKCLACNHQWRVNEARTCALRRYSSKK
jgi:hypothetical protein